MAEITLANNPYAPKQTKITQGAMENNPYAAKKDPPVTKGDTLKNSPYTDKSKYASTAGGSATFVDNTSRVQRMLNEQAEVKSKQTNYFESEDFLSMKAFEIRQRIVMYQNLGLQTEYQQAQAEGQEVVKKYLALQAKNKGGSTSTSA